MTGLPHPTFRTKFQGYDRQQIDRMVDRIERTLAGTARKDRVRVVDLQYFYFDVRVGGYDRRQVHEYLSNAITALRRKAVAA